LIFSTFESFVKWSLHWSRTRKDLGFERRNECKLPPRFPTRPK